MESHLGLIGQILSLLIPLLVLAVAWGKYAGKAKEHDEDIGRLYEKFKENDIVRNDLKKEYLSDAQHELKCKVATMEIKQDIRDTADEIKEKVEETMINFQEKFGDMFKDLVKEVKNNKVSNV